MALPCRNSVLAPFNFLANFLPEKQVSVLRDSVQRRSYTLVEATAGLGALDLGAGSGAVEGPEEQCFGEDIERATAALQCVLTLDKASLERSFRQDTRQWVAVDEGHDVDETNFRVVLEFVSSMLEAVMSSPCVGNDTKNSLYSWVSRARSPNVSFLAVFCAGTHILRSNFSSVPPPLPNNNTSSSSGSLTLVRFWYEHLSLLTFQQQAMLFGFWYQHCCHEETACKNDAWRAKNFQRWKNDKLKPTYKNELEEKNFILSRGKCLVCWGCERAVFTCETGGGRLKCGKCKYAVYCSKDCQSRDSGLIHKKVCGSLEIIHNLGRQPDSPFAVCGNTFITSDYLKWKCGNPNWKSYCFGHGPEVEAQQEFQAILEENFVPRASRSQRQ